MKILVYDNGLNTESAISLARAGHSVAYTTPWQEAFPTAAKGYIGRGLEGLEVVDSFTKALAKCDMVFCPDTFSEDRVAQARAAGKPTWGAGAAERMELDRGWMKSQQKDLGIPTGQYKAVVGIEKLIQVLKPHTECWVKSSKWRQIETFKHCDWETTRNQYIGPLLDKYGPVADQMEFLVEEPLKGVEIGIDGFFCNGNWVNPTGWGYEAKDEAYVGTWGDELPPLLKDLADKLRTPLAAFKACSFVSNEAIIQNGKAYQIEPTIRAPHPPTAGMLCMYSNGFPELVTQAVHRRYMNMPEPEAKYCAVLVIRSSWAGDHWLTLEIEPRFRQMVKLSQACKINGHYLAIPGNEFVGYCVGLGDTLKDAAEMAKKVAHGVKCRDMDVNESALDRLVEETVPEGKKVGINF